jgi:thiol-activated cytolysin
MVAVINSIGMSADKETTILSRRKTMNSSTYKTIVWVSISAIFLAAVAFSSPGAAYAHSTSLFDAISKPTPPDQPLDNAKATEFISLLAGETENNLDDFWDAAKVDQANEAIAADFAKRGEMTNQTPQQFLDVFLEDVKKAVTDSDLLNNISMSLGRLLTSSDEGSNPPDNIPAPAPHVTPSTGKLNEEGVAALKQKLEAALKGVVEDEETQNGIFEVWNTRMAQMVGKTSSEMVDQFLKDAGIAVTESEQMDQLRASFTVAINEGEPIGEPQPAPAPVQSAQPVATPEEKQKPASTPEAEPAPSAAASPDKEPTPAPGPSVAPEPKPAPPVRVGTNPSLRRYIQGLKYDPRKLLAVSGDGGTLLTDEPKAEPTKTRKKGDKTIIRCLTTERSLKKNFDEVAILQPTKGVIYPGALIYADKSLTDGKPRPLTGLPRNPIDLRLDLPGLRKEGSFTIADPTNGKVESALNEALDFWNNSTSFKDGYINPSRSSFDSTQAFSSEQLALSLGFNAKWASGDASAQFKYASSAEKNVIVAVYKQVFYSVTFDAPNLPEQFFDSSVTPEEAKEVFAASPDMATDQLLVPSYVSSVDYGRIIMFRMETDKSTKSVDAQAAFKYVGGSFSVSAEAKAAYDNIIKNSSITVVLMGGSAEVSSQLNAAKNVEDLQAIIRGKNAVYSKNNPGVPIAYTVKFLKDNDIAKMGATTDYRTEECQVLNNRYVKILHNGAYFGEFRVTWDNEDGTTGMWESTQALAGEKFTIDIPADATNVKLVLKSWAGLVGERREAFNKVLTPEEQNKCYRVFGGSLGPGWDNNCD